MDNHLKSDMLEQVVDFINRNTSTKAIAPKELYNPYLLPDARINDKQNVVIYSEANTAGILKKLREFSDIEEKKISEEELITLNGLLNSNDKQVHDICRLMLCRLLELVENWHQNHLFPGNVILSSLYNYIYFSFRCYQNVKFERDISWQISNYYDIRTSEKTDHSCFEFLHFDFIKIAL